MARRRNPQVAIVGPGRLGQALGRVLSQAGVPIQFIAARRIERARRAARFIGSGEGVRLTDPRLGGMDVIVLTASDGAIGEVAQMIAQLREEWRGRVALHVCGSLPASALEPFKRRGAWIGSLHPYQTIPSPSAGVRNLLGCYWAVEGDTEAAKIASRWVKRLKGVAFNIRAEAKPLYHLSAFLACPTVVTLMDKSAMLLKRAGVPQYIIRPMLAKFVSDAARNFDEFGARRALTGPVVRGDWKTLERHVAELRRVSPEVIPAYRELVRLMFHLAGVKAPKSNGKKDPTDQWL